MNRQRLRKYRTFHLKIGLQIICVMAAVQSVPVPAVQSVPVPAVKSVPVLQ